MLRRLCIPVVVVLVAGPIDIACFNPTDIGAADSTSGNTSVATAGGATTGMFTAGATDNTTTGRGSGGDSVVTTGELTSAGSATSSRTTGDATTAGSTGHAGSTDGSSTDGISTGGTNLTDSGSAGECEAQEICVQPAPDGWAGPVVVAASCPEQAPEPQREIHAGLVAGTYSCGCTCSLDSLSCALWLENAGEEFLPTTSCTSPPYEDECLSVVPEVSCGSHGSELPATPSWQTTTQLCNLSSTSAGCDGGGHCALAPGPTCVWRDGDHSCPDNFGERTLYYSTWRDTRACTSCECFPSGQVCNSEVEICSVGFFTQTLVSGGECLQLSSSDGDGVSLLSTSIANHGECTATPDGGALVGEISPIDPVTVCCAP